MGVKRYIQHLILHTNVIVACSTALKEIVDLLKVKNEGNRITVNL